MEEPDANRQRPGRRSASSRPAGRADYLISSPFAATWLVAWHSDLAAWLDRLGWLPTLSDWLTAVLGPVRERHQDNLAPELLHCRRRVGTPPHPPPHPLPLPLCQHSLLPHPPTP